MGHHLKVDEMYVFMRREGAAQTNTNCRHFGQQRSTLTTPFGSWLNRTVCKRDAAKGGGDQWEECGLKL